MRVIMWIGLLTVVVVPSSITISGQSGKGTPVPYRSAALPPDINPDSLNRLPVVKRDQMDENGKRVYDLSAGGAGKVVQPTGPGAISLYSPGVAEPLRQLNNYLRRDGNILGNPLTELAILVAAREGNQQYVWGAHEPAGLKAGLTQPAIDVVKYGKDVAGLGDKETVIIRLGRQLYREHKLNSETFAKAVELFGKQGTVEVVTLMGDYTLNGLLLDALDQHLPADRKALLPSR